MAETNTIPKKFSKYLRRLESEYSGTSFERIGQVIVGSEFRIEEETDYSWDGEERGHDVIFLVPDHLMVNIPLDDQEKIETRVKEDLNKASSFAREEYIANVYFDYLDEDGNAERLNLSQSDMAQDYEKLWSAKEIRLFISHRDGDKQAVHEVASYLREYGINSFVAHETIEPDEDWQREIRRALQSMDAMLVFITEALFQSIWVNQEIGYALARSVPIISIKLGEQDPAGFINHRQAIRGSIDNPKYNASKIRETLRKRLLSSPRYREVALGRFMKANSFKTAENTFDDLASLNDLSSEELSNLVDAYNANNQLHGCWHLSKGNRFLNFVNRFSEEKYTVKKNRIVVSEQSLDEDIPF